MADSKLTGGDVMASRSEFKQQLDEAACTARVCHGGQDWPINTVSRSRASLVWRGWWTMVAWWVHLHLVGVIVARTTVDGRGTAALAVLAVTAIVLWKSRMPRRLKQVIGGMWAFVGGSAWVMFATAVEQPVDEVFADAIFDALWLPMTVGIPLFLLAALLHLMTNAIVTRP